MRRRAALAAVLVAAFLALAAPAARALIGPPIAIRLERPPGPAEAGRVWRGQFRLTSARALELSELRVEAPGWADAALDHRGTAALAAGGSLIVTFTGVPSSDDAPLTIVAYTAGREVRQTFVVSRKLWEQTVVGAADRELPRTAARDAALQARMLPRSGASEPRPEPVADPARLSGAAARPETIASTSAARTITVSGRFLYTRPDGVEVPVDGATVRAYDEDIVNWQLGSADVTGSDGSFSITFTWDPCPVVCDQDPDIFLEFEAANGRVHVHPAIGFNYKWRTGTKWNRTSNSVDFGDRTPTDESLHNSLHMLSTVTRAWRWLRENASDYDPPDVGVLWTDPTIPGGGYYLLGDIHIGDGRDEEESTVVHEYGHHWVATYADFNQLPDYCNGVCDDGFGFCGHCGYCEESGTVALQEGFPHWFSQRIIRSFEQRYGVAPIDFDEFETNALCLDGNDDDCPCDPLKTEGFFAAFLRDLEDGSTNPGDPLQDRFPPYPGPGDELSDGHSLIFTVMDLDTPGSPATFFADYRARHPDYLESSLWATAKHNTYEFDTTNPGQVSGLASSSHAVGVPSGDHTIRVTWTPATDDLSGIGTYAVTFTQNSPCRPGVTPTGCGGFFGRTDIEALPAPSFTSGNLPNGSWYVNVLAVDRAGREGTNYRSLGPFVLRDPEPANLTWALDTGWTHEVVPRPTNDSHPLYCPDPVSLSPTANATWLNLCGQNDGDEAVSTAFDVDLLIDGVERITMHGSVIPPGNFYGNNQGPITVGSGRHTLEQFIDSGEAVSETDEEDNRIAYQWIWAPSAVSAPLTQISNVAPPDPTGSWEGAVGTTYFNCDGVRFNTPTTDWFVSAVYSLDVATDVDCRVHAVSTGPTNGFGANLGYSSRGEGCVDAVLVNRNVATGTAYDIGVLNQNGSTAAYYRTFIRATTFTFGDSVPRAFAANVPMQVLAFTVPSSGWVTVDLRHLSGPAPIHMRLFNRTLSTGDLDDDLAEVVVDTLGRGFVSASLTPGEYCVVVFRDPKDGLAGASYALEIGPTPPDFVPTQPAGWASSLVPRPAPDGTASSVPQPDTLHGNAALTYLNLAVRNNSQAASPAWTTHVLVDDVLNTILNYPALPGATNSVFNGSSPRTVRGGRHTLGARLDPASAVEELFETGNTTGGQWIWSPLALGFGTPVSRSSPPGRTAGWGDLGGGAWFNCDGLRIPAPSASSNWAGIAILPDRFCDYDVRIHERGAGATSGFASNLGYSGWDADQSDFVLVNFTRTSRRALDAGVLHFDGAGTYLAEAQQSSLLADDPDGLYGNFSIGADNLFRLHEVRLARNRTYRFTVIPTSGSIDWGMSLYRGDAAFRDKSSAIAAAWTSPAGQAETFEITAPDTGSYCLAIWKALSSDAGVSASYRIDVARSTVDAPGEATPGVTRLAGAHPNPARGDANIVFDLARETRVELEIYDVTGSRVRTLRNGNLAAGRHLAVWDRLDDRGRGMPAGVYWVRLDAEGVRQSRKFVLIR